jgi:hypothetical protein
VLSVDVDLDGAVEGHSHSPFRLKAATRTSADQTVSDPLQPDSKTQTTKIRNEVALRIEEKPPEPGLLINPTFAPFRSDS